MSFIEPKDIRGSWTTLFLPFSYFFFVFLKSLGPPEFLLPPSRDKINSHLPAIFKCANLTIMPIKTVLFGCSYSKRTHTALFLVN